MKAKEIGIYIDSENNWILHERRIFEDTESKSKMTECQLMVYDIASGEQVHNGELDDDVWQFNFEQISFDRKIVKEVIGETSIIISDKVYDVSIELNWRGNLELVGIPNCTYEFYGDELCLYEYNEE